jgi:plasmid stabilization system protein ParE
MTETYDVVWSRLAVRDLDQILDYLSEEASIDRALAVYEQVRQRISILKRHPRRCRVVPELRDLGLTDFRESILAPYRIVFRFQDQVLVLVAIVDSRRNLEELLVERALEA